MQLHNGFKINAIENLVGGIITEHTTLRRLLILSHRSSVSRTTTSMVTDHRFFLCQISLLILRPSLSRSLRAEHPMEQIRGAVRATLQIMIILLSGIRGL